MGVHAAYNDGIMTGSFVTATLVMLSLMISAVPAFAGSRPEPLATLRLLKDERGPLKVKTRSEEGVPLRVVFDTAAANSILFDHQRTSGVGDRLPDGRFVYFPFTDRLIDFQQLDWFALKLGDHMFRSNSWVYGPWKATGLFPGRDEPNYDVIAGRDVFTNFVVAIHPEKRRVKLYESGLDLTARYDAVLDLVDLNPLMGVRVTVNRADTGELSEKLMIIDTGFPGVLLFANEEELERLKADEYTAPAETLSDALLAPGRLQLGNLQFKEQIALIVSKGAFEADGVIGTSYLSNFSYAFDFASKKLYLTELR